MKAFALARVLQLAEQRGETLARGVKLAHGVWLRARGRQVQLAALRDAHVAQLALELRDGVTATHLREKNRLQCAQAAEMQATQTAIDEAHRVWQARLAEWMQQEQKLKALRLLEQRYLAQVAIQQRRIEQRQHDELVELAHHRDSGRRDAGRGFR
jgi:flagellar export protein FliJ